MPTAARNTKKRTARMPLENLRPSPASQSSRFSLPVRGFAQKKSPTRYRGRRAALFLAKSAQSLRHRRVAWLTAFQPITVAGPRPNFTAFPAAHACKLKTECMPRMRRCQRRRAVREIFSDSSIAACAFPPWRARLLAHLPAGTIHSGKYSWNVSSRLSATYPCPQEWLSWPCSAPALNGW